MIDWILANSIEITGATLGVCFLYFEIKQNWLLWPLGILTSLFYIFIFFDAKFYADMSLQFYYVAMSIYGWWYWRCGNKDDIEAGVPITRVTPTIVRKLIGCDRTTLFVHSAYSGTFY